MQRGDRRGGKPLALAFLAHARFRLDAMVEMLVGAFACALARRPVEILDVRDEHVHDVRQVCGVAAVDAACGRLGCDRSRCA